jgi:putative membrane protein
MKNEVGKKLGPENLLKGLAAGLLGGLVASAMMNQFQKVLGKVIIGEEESHGAQSLQEGAPEHGIGRALHEEGKDDPEDDSAERMANAVSVGFTGRALTKEEKDIGATAFHYAFGASMGAVYGAAADVVPAVTAGAGVPYGALIWLGADEGVVPLIGLSKTPEKYPASVHASALAAHLVYGLSLEITRKAVRKLL